MTVEAKLIPRVTEQGNKILGESKGDRDRGPRLDPLDQLQLSGQIREMFELAREAKRPLLQEWNRNYNLLFNRYWNRDYRPSWKAAAEVPEIWPIVAGLVGWATDQRVNYELSATAQLASQYYNFYDEIADQLELLLNTSWEANYEEYEMSKALWDMHVYGTGFTKTVWNPTLAGGLGDAQTQHVSPFHFYPDPNATSLDDMDWCIEVKHMSIGALDRRFPGAANKLMGAGPEDIDEQPTQTSRNGGRHGRANPGIGSPGKISAPNALSTGETSAGSLRYGAPGAAGNIAGGTKAMAFHHQGVTVFEAWFKEHDTIEIPRADGKGTRKSVKDYWRVVVMCNDVILMDRRADKLWSHGGHPYDRFPFADLGEFWGPSLVSLLRSPQELLNKVLVAMTMNVDLVGNPVLIEPKGSGLERQKVHNRPGERLDVNPSTAVLTRWLDPPSLHQAIPELLRYLQLRMEAISGLTAIAKGGTPQGRNSESVVDTIQEAALVRVRMVLRSLERGLTSAGRKKASLIIDNYTQPRTMAVLGRDGRKTHLALRANHFQSATPKGSPPLTYNIKVDAGSQRETGRQARAERAMALFTLGAIDEESLLQELDWPKAQQTAERVQQLRAQQAMAEPGKRERSRA